jgi:hypothetical protein
MATRMWRKGDCATNCRHLAETQLDNRVRLCIYSCSTFPVNANSAFDPSYSLFPEQYRIIHCNTRSATPKQSHTTLRNSAIMQLTAFIIPVFVALAAAADTSSYVSYLSTYQPTQNIANMHQVLTAIPPHVAIPLPASTPLPAVTSLLPLAMSPRRAQTVRR